MYKLIAFCVFMMSATAVPIGPVRLSDIAFAVGLLLLIVVGRSKAALRQSAAGLIIPVLAGLVLSCLVSWMLQLGFAPTSDIDAGFMTAIIVPLAIVFAIMAVVDFDREQTLRLVSAMSSVFVGCLIVALVQNIFLPQPSWLIIDYEATDRFSALSLNPNQTALAMLPIPFFAFLAWREGLKPAWLAIAEIVLIFVVNLYAFGKALFLAWILGFLLPVYLELGIRFRQLKIVLVVFGVIAAPIGIYYLSQLIEAFYTGSAQGSMEGQGENRIILWTHGLQAWSDAILFGHGPGAFSGVNGPYEQTESHNTLIDWGASYGLVGVLVLLLMPLRGIRSALARRDWLLLGYFVALTFQSGFHFYGRQPFFWLWWVLGFMLAAAPVKEQSQMPVRRGGAMAPALRGTTG